MSLSSRSFGPAGTAPGALARARQRLEALPRATRDTLFLLAVLAWTLAPHAERIPPWCTGLAAAALLWRARLALVGGALPSRRVMLGFIGLICLAAWHSLPGASSRDAGVTLLVMLAALKTLELRARRDAVVVFFIGFLVVMTHFLYAQTLLLSLAMTLSVLGLLTALLLAQLPDLPDGSGGAARSPGLGEAARLALKHFLLGLPLVVALFLLFPRLPPLWGVTAEGLGRTGLSERLELGQVAELAGDDALAMRVRFVGEVPPRDQLYFRGPVLGRYDGRAWHTLPDLGLERIGLVQGAAYAYEMTVEPLRIASLPLLELSLETPQVAGADLKLTLRDDLHWQPDRLIAERLQVRARASLALHHPGGRLPRLRDEHLALPPTAQPGLRAWARDWAARLERERPGGLPPRGSAAYADHLTRALLATISAENYHYTLTPGEPPPGADALDHFWLEGRRGFCEHYAAATVVILRSLGVPARIVTGYLGGQVNGADGQLELRQSDAHAWVEYWRAGHGWVRTDPTGAVAPERILQGRRAPAPQGLISGALAQVSPELVVSWQSWRDRWTALEQRWNDAVLGFGAQRQRDWLRGLGFEHVDATLLARLLAGLLSVGGLLLAGQAWLRQHLHERGDPWLRDWTRVQALLRDQGWPLPGHLSPRGVTAWLDAHAQPADPSVRQRLIHLLDDFERVRYARSSRPIPATTGLHRRVIDVLRALHTPAS